MVQDSIYMNTNLSVLYIHRLLIGKQRARGERRDGYGYARLQPRICRMYRELEDRETDNGVCYRSHRFLG
jgi:hypothetical protein